MYGWLFYWDDHPNTMFTTFQNIHDNFYRELFGDGLPQSKNFTAYDASTFPVTLRFGSPGAEDYTQEKRESYPQIIIVPFDPVLREGFASDIVPYFAKASVTPDTITQFFDQVAMAFRYEITVCTKRNKQQVALSEWFQKNFFNRVPNVKQQFFQFNEEAPINYSDGTETPCDLVEYTIKVLAEPERSDGVREVIYEFMLYPFFQMIDPVDMPVITDLILRYHLQ